MRFYTPDEADALVSGRGFQLAISGNLVRRPENGLAERQPVRSKPLMFDVGFAQTAAFARHIVSATEYFDDCLMWVVEWGIWPSSENLHLYYKLRQSYGERTLLLETPGHFFLGHERSDLASFVQLAVLFGWGFHLLTFPANHWTFVSHDEYLVVSADDQSTLDAAVDHLGPFCKRPPSAT